MTKEPPTPSQKMTVYLWPQQVRWLKHKALSESESRGCEVTASQILREILDQATKNPS